MPCDVKDEVKKSILLIENTGIILYLDAKYRKK